MVVTALYDQYKNDYLVLDNVETVTISPRNPTATDITTVEAKKYSFSLQEQAKFGSNIELHEDNAFFLVFDTTLSGTLLKADDLITHDSVTYRITSANRAYFDTQWQVIARKQK